MAKRVGKWLGGYIRKTASGKPVYVVEQRHQGRRVHFSTGANTLPAATKEWEKFQLDPIGYEPGGQAGDAVILDAELVLAYREHQLAKGLTKEWTDEVARCLADWQIAINGRDLRGLKLHRDLIPALEKWKTQRPHRIKAIKGLFRWLRQEKGLVERVQDATLDLRVPQARAEKLKRRKIVPPENVEAVLQHLPETTRDILHLLTATAWHVSEARRFAEDGEIHTPKNADGVLAVLITRHKSGDFTKTPIVHPEHLEVAKRVKAIARFPKRITLARHMRTAREVAKVPYFAMGWMRHSVLTWGVEDGGASKAQAAEFAQHRSQKTTERFYLDLNVPKNTLPVYRLLPPVQGETT